MARAVVETCVWMLVVGLALFVPAGRLSWPMGWAVLGVYGVICMAALALFDRGLLIERSRVPPSANAIDVVLAGLAGVLLYPATLVVCGQDARGNAEAGLPATLQLAALATFALGYAFALWAARTNRFFSTVVRMQPERGHRVVDTGPYAFVRHPGYAGAMLAHLALPLALGSLRGLVPAACGVGALALRIVYEERTLRRDLSGYREYVQRVRWRLIPGLW